VKTLLQLVVLAALGYALWAYGVPWIQRQVGQSRPPVSDPASGAGGVCVQVAARASEELHDNLLDRARPLIDDASWDEVASEVRWALDQARSTCGCKLESCALARSALTDLTTVYSVARGQFRSSQSIPLELGRQYEKANQQLWDAYHLAREGK